MADKKQLKILKQGVHVWNTWWDKNRTVHVDLSKTDLANADLSGAILRGADSVG